MKICICFVSKSKLSISLPSHFLRLVRRYLLFLLVISPPNCLVQSHRNRVSLLVKLHLSLSGTLWLAMNVSSDFCCPPWRLNVDRRVKLIPFMVMFHLSPLFTIDKVWFIITLSSKNKHYKRYINKMWFIIALSS